MDGGALWAAVCGVALSRTRLKRLSSSSSSRGAVVSVNLSLQLSFVNLKLSSNKVYLKMWC